MYSAAASDNTSWPISQDGTSRPYIQQTATRSDINPDVHKDPTKGKAFAVRLSCAFVRKDGSSAIKLLYTVTDHHFIKSGQNPDFIEHHGTANIKWTSINYGNANTLELPMALLHENGNSYLSVILQPKHLKKLLQYNDKRPYWEFSTWHEQPGQRNSNFIMSIFVLDGLKEAIDQISCNTNTI